MKRDEAFLALALLLAISLMVNVWAIATRPKSPHQLLQVIQNDMALQKNTDKALFEAQDALYGCRAEVRSLLR